MHRRLGGCRISHTPFASLSLGSLGARLAARFVAIQAVCGFAAAFGSPPPKPKAAASSHQQFFTSKQCVYIDVFVRSLAYNKLKTHLLRREAKLLTRSASKPTGKIFRWRGKILPQKKACPPKLYHSFAC